MHPGSVRARHNVPKAKAKARGRRSGDAMPIPVNDDPIPSELKASCLMDVESMEESLCTLQSLSMDVQAHNFEVVEKPG